MARKKRSALTLAIQSTGMNVTDFAVQKLQISYQTYINRVNAGGLRLADYHAILFYTGQSFETLFPNPLQPKKVEKIPLVLGSRTIPAQPALPPGHMANWDKETLDKIESDGLELDLGMFMGPKELNEHPRSASRAKPQEEAKEKGDEYQQRPPTSKPNTAYVFTLEDVFDNDLPGAVPTPPPGKFALPPDQDDV